MCALQVSDRDVEILLRGHQIRVAENLLDIPDIHSVVEAVCCEAMPKLVWMYPAETRSRCSIAHDSANLTTRNWKDPAAHSTAQVFAQRAHRWPADPHHAVLAALSFTHSRGRNAPAEVHVLDAQSCEFADTDTRRVENLDDGAIAWLGRSGNQSLDLVWRERFREALRNFPGLNELGRRGDYLLAELQEMEKRSQRKVPTR